MPFDRQMIQELLQFWFLEFAGVAFAVKDDETANPAAIGVFCTWTHVPTTAGGTNLIHEADCLEGEPHNARSFLRDVKGRVVYGAMTKAGPHLHGPEKCGGILKH